MHLIESQGIWYECRVLHSQKTSGYQHCVSTPFNKSDYFVTWRRYLNTRLESYHAVTSDAVALAACQPKPKDGNGRCL